jgi:hypothetical protein
MSPKERSSVPISIKKVSRKEQRKRKRQRKGINVKRNEGALFRRGAMYPLIKRVTAGCECENEPTGNGASPNAGQAIAFRQKAPRKQ